MSESMREQVALRLASQAESGLRRLTFELGGEQVSLWLRNERLVEHCTCGLDSCEHVATALRFVAGAASGTTVEARPRSSSRPPSHELMPLIGAFEDLCLATARSGIEAASSPSIKRGISELLNAAPRPTPLAIARFVGRLQEALTTGNVGDVAMLFEGALRWVEEVRRGDAGADALARRRVWVGGSELYASESLADATLIEVAREWVAGTERAQIERRYLIDLASGEPYIEERRRTELEVSVGPCPRLILVSYAEVIGAARPKRARLLQYTVSLQLGEPVLARMLELALVDVAALREHYANELRLAPALAEPFVLFAPATLEPGSQGGLRDASGARLDFAHPELVGADAVRAATREGELACVLGRLVARGSGVQLVPLSAIVRRGAWLELSRVT
jgi:hypothetical protein